MSNNTNFYKNLYNSKYGVIELKRNDFEIKKNKVFIKNKKFKENKSIIIVYAPWCSHCRSMYESIIDLSLTNLNKFQIGAINISDIKNKNYLISNALEIKSIPKACILKDKGELVLFDKQINYDNLFYYINMNLD
jgi:thiol-disulfide isomerase/thioredoxin